MKARRRGRPPKVQAAPAVEKKVRKARGPVKPTTVVKPRTQAAGKQRCPTCGASWQPPLDNGVQLTPIKSKIYDKVKRAGKSGIAMSDLIGSVYGDEHVTTQAMRSHIWQINERLEEVGTAIRARHGAYVLEQRAG